MAGQWEERNLMRRAAMALSGFLQLLHPHERWMRAEERRLRLTLGQDWVQRRLA